MADELTLEESNAARIQAINAVGAGVNGVNEALLMMVFEELLGEERMHAVQHKHQVWLSEQLDGIEEQLAARQQKAEEDRRKAVLLRGGQG